MELFATTSGKQGTPKKAPTNATKSADAVAICEQRCKDTTGFAALGLSSWICKSVQAMGFRYPTDIQSACIPAILKGKDVMGCAETGSGKTAAFCLPILDHLSQDPYGIFAIVLTPTRELAMQIYEQFAAIGAPIGLKQSLIIGGENMTEQSRALALLPHVVISTPGRLRHHLLGCDPPNIGRTQYLVLDEADRLLSAGFAGELKLILSRMRPQRKTLLFSATLTSSLSELESLAATDTVRFDLTVKNHVPERLVQQYLFVPARVKLCYLVALLKYFIESEAAVDDAGNDDAINSTSSLALEIIEESSGRKRRKVEKKKFNTGRDKKTLHSPQSSIIIFVGSCRKCEEINATLQELGIECTSLHSMMSQHLRIASLNKFKSRVSRILVATDVASRGLDIPSVELVINVDLPKVVSDYVHRVGRTARAGRAGRAVSLVTQYDVDIVHAIEEFVGQKLDPAEDIKDTDVVTLLNPVSKAMRLSKAKLLEAGFDEKVANFVQRKKKQRRKLLRAPKAAAEDASAK